MILLFLLFSCVVSAMNTDRQIVLVPHNGRYWVTILIRGSSIYVEDDNATHIIPIERQNTLLRQILARKSPDKFLDGTYIFVQKTSRGKYFLSARESDEK